MAKRLEREYQHRNFVGAEQLRIVPGRLAAAGMASWLSDRLPIFSFFFHFLRPLIEIADLATPLSDFHLLVPYTSNPSAPAGNSSTGINFRSTLHKIRSASELAVAFFISENCEFTTAFSLAYGS
nr:hypothetical protein Iba_chr04dCG8690 [Ipomoea batatas]